MENTQDFIRLLYNVEDALLDLSQKSIVHNFSIKKNEKREFTIEIFLSRESVIDDVYAKAKQLVAMAVSVQKFPAACLIIRYKDHQPIVNYPDVYA